MAPVEEMLEVAESDETGCHPGDNGGGFDCLADNWKVGPRY